MIHIVFYSPLSLLCNLALYKVSIMSTTQNYQTPGS